MTSPSPSINTFPDSNNEKSPIWKKSKRGVSGTIANAVSIQPTDVQLTSACIADRLFLEICSAPKKTVIYEFPPLPKKEEKINKYYAEAATYARGSSAGNFSGKNAKYKPVFHLDSKDFSPELRANLVERLNTSKESLHRVIEDAVFMIFRARHRMIFYQHIEAEGLRWEFV